MILDIESIWLHMEIGHYWDHCCTKVSQHCDDNEHEPSQTKLHIS